MLAKIGPGENTICRRPVVGSSWMRSVPVMSDGIRSGVNWMRENFSSSTRASVCTRRVFARPGTPTMRLLPPVNSVSSTSLTTSSWPTIALRSSEMMRSRPVFIRSASATSSGDSRSTVLVATATCPPLLVQDPVHEIVDAVLERFVVQRHRHEPFPREFPVLADVPVDVGNRDQPFRRIVVLEDPPVGRAQPPAGVDRMRLERRRILDLEERVPHVLRPVADVDPPRFRQHAAHLILEVGPGPFLFAEVVENDEAAFLEIRAEALGFLVGRHPVARLDHVGDRIVEQLRIVERQDVRPVDPRVHVRDLLQDLPEMHFAARIVVRPRRTAALPAEPAAAVTDAEEHEAAVVRRIALVFDLRLLESAAAVEPLRLGVRDRRHGGGRHARENDADERRSHLPFPSASRICRVFSASSVASFSSSDAYLSGSMPLFSSLSESMRRSIAWRST